MKISFSRETKSYLVNPEGTTEAKIRLGGFQDFENVGQPQITLRLFRIKLGKRVVDVPIHAHLFAEKQVIHKGKIILAGVGMPIGLIDGVCLRGAEAPGR